MTNVVRAPKLAVLIVVLMEGTACVVGDRLPDACNEGDIALYRGGAWACTTPPAGPRGATGDRGPAGTAGASPFQQAGNDVVFEGGRVAVGTSTPSAVMELRTDEPAASQGQDVLRLRAHHRGGSSNGSGAVLAFADIMASGDTARVRSGHETPAANVSLIFETLGNGTLSERLRIGSTGFIRATGERGTTSVTYLGEASLDPAQRLRILWECMNISDASNYGVMVEFTAYAAYRATEPAVRVAKYLWGVDAHSDGDLASALFDLLPDGDGMSAPGVDQRLAVNFLPEIPASGSNLRLSIVVPFPGGDQAFVVWEMRLLGSRHGLSSACDPVSDVSR